MSRRRKRRQSLWDKKEEDILYVEWLAGTHVRDIAVMLRRTYGSVYTKARDMGLGKAINKEPTIPSRYSNKAPVKTLTDTVAVGHVRKRNRRLRRLRASLPAAAPSDQPAEC